MKILVYGDPHWCAYSSIVRSRGVKYSKRLENLIASINWVEQTATQLQCDKVICLGDFFDKAELNSEEITALQEVVWADAQHTFLVGNHEMGRSNLQFSSAHLFDMSMQCQVIDRYGVFNTEDGTELCFLPYILEQDRKPLKEYLGDKKSFRIVFSHNDIKDVQMGKFKSTEGFSVSEIEDNCDLFVNGHLHNISHIGTKIINLGNITGQNFSEDANLYRHYALYIDTATHQIEWYENPYSFNFYKLSLVGYKPVSDTDLTIPDLFKYCITGNAIVTVKTCSSNEAIIRESLANSKNIIESRVIVDMIKDTTAKDAAFKTDFSVDHLAQFVSYMTSLLGSSTEVVEELNKVVSI